MQTSTEIVKQESTTVGVFSSAENFEFAQRMAKALASSSIVPAAYQNNISNAIIALDMAGRMGESPLVIMQNLDIIKGRPSFGAKYIISKVNTCGRYEPLEFEYFGQEGTDGWGCFATTTEIKSGKVRKGAKVTLSMAKAEGWFGKDGSKWKTMPEMMLMYRAGAFWQRQHAPQLTMGMITSEEMEDIPGTLDIVHEEIKKKGNVEVLEFTPTEPEVIKPTITEEQKEEFKEVVNSSGNGVVEPLKEEPQPQTTNRRRATF